MMNPSIVGRFVVSPVLELDGPLGAGVGLCSTRNNGIPG
jgi:hypothetical protein